MYAGEFGPRGNGREKDDRDRNRGVPRVPSGAPASPRAQCLFLGFGNEKEGRRPRPA